MRTPTGSRWISDNYITRCHRRLELVSSSQFQFSSSCSWSQLGDKMPAWESACWLRACGPQWPRLSSTARMRKKCCYGQKNFGSICGSLSPSPTQLSHATNINPFATLSRIKCERYIFIKKCVRSFIEVRTLLLTMFLPIVVLWIYNTFPKFEFRSTCPFTYDNNHYLKTNTRYVI